MVDYNIRCLSYVYVTNIKSKNFKDRLLGGSKLHV